MNEKYFPFIFFTVMILMFVNFYHRFLKLRNLLRKHHKPVSNILWGLGLARDIKQAKLLIKELEDSQEIKEVKTALIQTNIAYLMIFVIFFTLGALLLMSPNIKFSF